MAEFKRLLIQVKGEQGVGQPAIQRALSLAEKGVTALVLLLPTYVRTEDLASVLDEEQRNVLQRHAVEKAEASLSLLAGKLRAQGHAVETRIGWHRYPYEAVIAAALEDRAELVLSAVSPHSRLERLVVTPDERQLLRFCPCPVWLVKDAGKSGLVLAALDAGTSDPEHQALNRAVAEAARQVARCLGTRWQILSAFPGTPLMYPANVSLDIPKLEQEGMDVLRDAARQYGEPLGLTDADILVERGPAGDVLCEQAQNRHAALLVVGTVARTGLDAFLIGNTAEQLIDHSACDILAIKPAGFVCPLKLES